LGGFTSDALRESRASSKHIETMNPDRLISLWQEHYEKLTETGKALLPLVKGHFLAPSEE
jgi:restriction system protein